MEMIEILLKIVMPISIAVFLWIERRSIRNLIADFRLEKNSQGIEVTEDEILNKMKKIMGYQYVDRP